MCICMYVWRPELNTDVFLNRSPHYFFKLNLSLNLELISWMRPTGQWDPLTHLSLSSQHGESKCALPHLFMWARGLESRSSCWRDKPSPDWVISPALGLSFPSELECSQWVFLQIFFSGSRSLFSVGTWQCILILIILCTRSWRPVFSVCF